ncbi:hypothetical protein COF01_27950 [Bacillus pseudomycoides]|nr:RNA chaperone Hfq [Bacillus pseudomycoides]MED1624463.1 RNA chaperone Hfq [Bacillus pseudomycoides]PDX99431.1 hypothetical protein COO07_16620 [Bacillus pseudomycoides]PDZ70441.1 hypothetical protein CON58_28970 [Bacillus pseudomycoides]PEF21761.1 hypothetical protein CON69_26010 [Bacillus pseudomycoides]PEK73407.1 hypothetical protein CN597_29380 [Bacillus pseudomycoides]
MKKSSIATQTPVIVAVPTTLTILMMVRGKQQLVYKQAVSTITT